MNTFNLKTPATYEINVSKFKPRNTIKAAVMIASATGVKQSLYMKFAQFLSEHGFVVYTFDYGGIGNSLTKPLKDFHTSTSLWAKNDCETLIEHIKTQYPNIPLLAIGHSIGGQLLGLTPANAKIDGILLVAAQTGYWKMWPGLTKIKMWFLWFVLSPLAIKLYGFFPGKILGSCEDLPKGMFLEWRKWCMSQNYLFDCVEGAHNSYNQIACPIVSFSAKDDEFAPKNVVDWLSNKFINAKVTRTHLIAKEVNLNSIGHFGYFKSDKQILWKLLLNSLKRFLNE